MLYYLLIMTKKAAHSLSKYYFGIIGAYVIWAAAGPVIRLTLRSVPPFTFLFIRLLIVCVLVLPYTIYQLKQSAIVRNDYFKIVWLGIFAQTSLIFIFLGFKYTTALEGTIIGMLGPILSVAAGHYFYHEKIDWHVKIGLSTAILGTLFVAFEPYLTSRTISHEVELRMLGNFFIILYSLSFLLYIIWSKISLGINSDNTKRTLRFIHIKTMRRHYSPLLLMSLSFYVGLVSFIPLSIMELMGWFGPVSFNLSQLHLTPVLGILYMSVLSSIVAYYLFEWGLTKVAVKDTAIFSYLQPVFALPFAYALLGEVPNQYMLLGAAIIALGVLIAEDHKS